MSLPISVLILVIVISSILNIFMLLAQYFLNGKSKVIVYWIFAFSIFTVSELIDYNYVALGGSQVFAVIAVGTLLVLGFVVISAGLKVFFERRITYRLYAFIMAGILLTVTAYFFHQNYNIQQGFLLIFIAITCSIIAKDLYSEHKIKKNITAKSLAYLFIFYVLMSMIQAGIDFWEFEKLKKDTQLITPFIYLQSYVMIAAAGFSLILLVNQRLVNERQSALNALQISEKKYRTDFYFLQSVLESPQDIIIFSLDNNYCYTEFTTFHKQVMEKIWGADIYKGLNMLDIIDDAADKAKAKINFDRALNGEFFTLEEAYGNEKLYRTYYENRYSPVKNSSGAIVGVSVFVIDVTEKRRVTLAIQEVKNHFETLFKINPDATVISSLPDGEILYVNDAFETASGYSRAEVIGNTVLSFGFWAYPAERDVFFDTINSKGFCNGLEITFIPKSGIKIPFLVSAKVYHINGAPHLISIIHDISKRIAAQNEIIREKILSDSIINSLPGVFYLFTRKGKLLRWNKNLQIVTQYKSDELRSMPVIQFITNEEKKVIVLMTKDVIKNGEAAGEANLLTSTNKRIPFYFTGTAISYEGEVCIMGVGVDISERIEAEEKIRITTEKLRQLTTHLESVREQERKRIGREIHDELGQQLTAIKMDVAWIEKKTSEESTAIKNKLTNILQLINGSNESVRRILNELRPGILEDYGILEAMELLSEQFTNNTGIPVEFKSPPAFVKTLPETSICIFRVYQEALTNITRYATAKRVCTSLSVKNNIINVIIEDNGQGFDLGIEKNKNSFGILGMRERVFSLKGDFELVSVLGSGTKIMFSLPNNT
jgi:PAS domain S-box-containing protein